MPQNSAVYAFLVSFQCLPFAAGVETAPSSPSPEAPASSPAVEDVYHGELVSFPGPWSFQIGKSWAVMVSDEQLEQLADPDKKVNLSVGPTPNEMSLRQICESAKAAGHRTLIVAFDHFFEQYRPGQRGKPRQLTPDKPGYIRLIANISRFAGQYGLGLELSLLTPLEIGPAYAAETGEHGVWMHYRKGVRDPKTGAYSVQLWRQTRWTNNKGPVDIQDAGVRVFAFSEKRLYGSPYVFVDPKTIVEISGTAHVEVYEGTKQSNQAVRVRIYGTGVAEAPGLDHVLVVQMYKTPEMDYFSGKALPYLKQLIDRYVDAGVQLNALYSDEMHIQQDWGYHNHHDNGEFALRYVSPGLAARYAELYGPQYRDFAKYLIYFTYGQEDCATDLRAKERLMHAWGHTPEDIRATALFRSRYYKLLQDGVVDLFTQAKHHLEHRVGRRIEAHAHATWAESPTCDLWRDGRTKYEYTPAFVWSNTVQQAASACHDYFKWGDFLTGNGNDHAEGGWLDRNYSGITLASSTGILNDVPYSYAAHWGMPGEVSQRRQALVNASGAAAQPAYAAVEGAQHRDVQVLMLYPLDLVATEERFGSWMSQYAYANQITQAKLLERGKVVNGAIEVAGRRFTTLVAQFEPFPSPLLLQMMRQLAEQGGRVIWSGPPPVLACDSTSVLQAWQDLFAVDYTPERNEGLATPCEHVRFEGILADLPPMPVLTDYLVDHVYPVVPHNSGASPEVVARVRGLAIGTRRTLPTGGSLVVLGFRPRDDQSASLGYEARWWFEILQKLGAYPPTGRFADANDNTEYLSRTTNYFVCRFPNGAVALAPHLRDLQEDWPGGFLRNPEEDKAVVARLKLPSDRISLKNFKVNGHTLTYEGQHAVAFRSAEDGTPVAFCGSGCNRIGLDGRTTTFADQPMALIAWAPVDAARRVDGGAVMQILAHGSGDVHIPVGNPTGPMDLIQEGATLGSRGSVIPSRVENGVLTFTATSLPGKCLYLVPRKPGEPSPR